jgi:hypothetical protein
VWLTSPAANGTTVPSPQSIVPVTVSTSVAATLRVTSPLAGTASGPVILTTGAVFSTVIVVVYSRRPPSLSTIAARTGSVAGPSVVGTVRVAPPGTKPPLSTLYS